MTAFHENQTKFLFNDSIHHLPFLQMQVKTEKQVDQKQEKENKKGIQNRIEKHRFKVV